MKQSNLSKLGLNSNQIKTVYDNDYIILADTEFKEFTSKKDCKIQLKSNINNNNGVIIGFGENLFVLRETKNGAHITEINEDGIMLNSWSGFTLSKGLIIFSKVKTYFVGSNCVIPPVYSRIEDKKIAANETFSYKLERNIKKIMVKEIDIAIEKGKQAIIELAHEGNLKEITKMTNKLMAKESSYGSIKEVIELSYFLPSYNKRISTRIQDAANATTKIFVAPELKVLRLQAANILKSKKAEIVNRMIG